MKTPTLPITLIAVALSFAGVQLACTDEKHDDDHKAAETGKSGHDHSGIEDGPNGGRLLTSVEPHLEFFVTEDRKVQISSVTDDDKLQPIADQEVSVIGGDRSNPTRMKFTKKGDVLVSDIAFPEGNDFPVVVMITPTPAAEKVTERFNLNLEQCPECPNLEYACTCDHEH